MSGEILVLIPARGGSKGLPGKNIKNFCGKPLISYSIDIAKKSEYVSRIVVTTDDEEIANVSKEFGAEVPFMRPEDLATDDSKAIDSFIHALKWLKEKENYESDGIVILYPTCPIRDVKDLDKGISIFLEKQADSVISVKEAFPKRILKEIRDDGVLQRLGGGEIELINRQDWKSVYVHNGVFFIFNPKLLLEKRSYYGNKTFPYVMEDGFTVDIDTLLDFQRGEALYKYKEEK